MSSLANSSAEPSYIPRLALNSAPFNNAVETSSYFKGGQIEQRLNLLLHLLRASDKVAGVFSAQGLGKTTLLSQLQYHAGDDLRICRIKGEASLSPNNLVAQCLRSFGVDEHEIEQGSQSSIVLKNRLKRLEELNIKSVLIIDDIDKLANETLAIVSDYLSWQDEEQFLLHAVFSASRLMPELGNIHGRMQRIDLATLAENELSAYLMHRLTAVGYQAELPFNAKQLKQFYQKSNGNPAQLNQLAHQQLLGITINSTMISFNPAMFKSGLKWLGVAVLVLSLSLLLIFQDRVNSFFSETAVLVDNNDIIIFEPATPLTEVVADEPVLVDVEQEQRSELESLISELSVNEDSDNKARVVDKLPTTVEAEVVVEELETTIYQQDWIRKQNASDYTFQLMGSWNHDELSDFIEHNALAGDVAEFESLRNGRVWYALVYGVFSSKQQALAASKTWPAPLNTLPSWLRRFDSVQKQIKARQQAQ